MDIGFYHDAAGTRHAGGIAVYTQRMAAELSKRHDVTLYTGSGEIAPVLSDSDVTIVETPSFRDHPTRWLDPLNPLGAQNREKFLMTLWAARNDVIDHMNDHLDVLCTYQFLDDLLLSNLVDIPTLHTFHRASSVSPAAWVRDRLSQTDLLVANSDDTARQLTEAFDYDFEGIVYPGVDLDQFRPGVEPAFETDRPAILFVGRLVESKGIDDLLEGVAALDVDQEVHFVGRGDHDRIRQRATRLGIHDDVVCHGEVPHPDLPAYYAAADVFCLPSHTESFGLVNVEAMACGLPVVTTDLEGIKTYLSNGENGLLTQVGDPQDLTDKLTMLLESPALRSRLGEQARADVQDFSWTAQARHLERICRNGLETVTEIDRPSTVPARADTI
ncbi:glycosyltransferase family 4 protein [Natrinema halophilum]|uniref:Glycosyltransferase family 4 protein n=1 Tax=Natrinema halophilum TaxID=1699371 RepID=A0A7D5H1U0_9EURY|nr:glycosyltransferase family 4 protein [Natrinema halophilum]QLG48571.1 glycosyltransferase family 4 protein [Natrinema halophilum]